jgi:hypothetical protein
MEPTSNSPPPYRTEDMERLTNDYNNLQQYAQHQNDMIIYGSDYQIFDNSWRIWKLLEIQKRQLQSSIDRLQTTVEHTKRQQNFLIQKANRYYHVLNTPEIQRRMNGTRQPSHPNTPIPRPQTISPILTPMVYRPIFEQNETTFHTPEPNEIISPRMSPVQRTSRAPRATTSRNQRQERCHRCRRTGHQKKDCPRYQCLRCSQYRPGHFTHECPTNSEGSRENPIEIDWDENDRYYDYDPDGNLDGER